MTAEVATFAASALVQDRRIEALAVPYNEPTSDGRNIAFSAGSFGDTNRLANVAVYINHPITRGTKPIKIGRVSQWIDTENGMSFAADVFDGDDENLIYEALRNGEVTDVSVSVSAHAVSERDGITYFDQVEPIEISLMVGETGAFASSKITAVFSAADTNPEAPAPESPEKEYPTMDIETQVSDLAGAQEDLAREFASFASAHTPAAAPQDKFASFGQVLKAAVSDSDQDAVAAIQDFAYTGGTTADAVIKHAWAKPVIRLIDNGRPVANLFDKYPDPKTNSIDYLTLGANTIQVAEQVNEGDDLAYGKISLSSATTSMKTYGGWTALSRQEIDRADASVIDLSYKALARKYAQVTEARVKTVALGASSPSVTGLNLNDFDTVIGTAVDASAILEDNGHAPEFLLIDRASFKKLAQADTEGHYLLNRDTTGSVNVRGLSATLFGLPVKVVNHPTPVFMFANSSLVSIWESGVGRLSDDNIVNLTSQFSLYGYLGCAVTDATAAVKVTA